MLILNVLALLESKGITHPQRHLVANGIPYYTVSRLVNNKTATIAFETMEKLCLLCNCTLDDLFVWAPDETMANAENYTLQKLKAKPKAPNPVERIKKLPLKKLQVLQEFIDKLEKEN